VTLPFPEPTAPVGSATEVLVGYLDYFRTVLLDKVEGLPDDERRTSRLPSGWTPLQLLVHLTYVERRWLEWGFLGADIGNPWGDERAGHWHVDPELSFADLAAGLRGQGERSREIAADHQLTDVGKPGPRWAGSAPATLERVLLHLIQEYARHVGQVDVVRELVDGTTGE